MIDIVDVGTDLIIMESQISKAKNIMNIQLGALEYAPEFGIDLRYFLQDDLKFQNESFQSYLIEVLSRNGINVASLTTRLEDLFAVYNFNLAPEDQSTALVAR